MLDDYAGSRAGIWVAPGRSWRRRGAGRRVFPDLFQDVAPDNGWASWASSRNTILDDTLEDTRLDRKMREGRCLFHMAHVDNEYTGDMQPRAGNWIYQIYGNAPPRGGGRGYYWASHYDPSLFNQAGKNINTYSLILINQAGEKGARILDEFPTWEVQQQREKETYDHEAERALTDAKARMTMFERSLTRPPIAN